jgi:hypothetical protein
VSVRQLGFFQQLVDGIQWHWNRDDMRRQRSRASSALLVTLRISPRDLVNRIPI